VGYALLKAKSSKILKQDGAVGEDQSAEEICSLYVEVNFEALGWLFPCQTESE